MITRRCIAAEHFAIMAGLLLANFPGGMRSIFAEPSQKPRVEEEDPEKSKVPVKIEPKGSEPTPVRPALPPSTFRIAQAAANAKNLFVRDSLSRIAFPHDKLVAATGKTYNIFLFPDRKLPDGKFTYRELNLLQTGGKEKELPTGAGFTLKPYEEIVYDEIDGLLKKKLDGVRRDEVLELGVQVLQATRRFHALAVAQNKRVGKDWEPVDEMLRKRIVQLRRDQLQIAIDAKEWQKVDDLVGDLTNYPDEPEVQKDIYRLLLRKALNSLQPNRDEDYQNLRAAVVQFEKIAAGRGDPLALKAREILSKRASDFVSQATQLAEKNQSAAALSVLKNADALYPDLPGISNLRLQLSDRILYVGVPRLPQYLSPATARDDAERWGVELLFESLLQAVPDLDLGRRYRPVLAEALPIVSSLGRDFTLIKNARWANDPEKTINAHDILGTLKLLDKQPFLPCADGIDVLDLAQFRVKNSSQFHFSFRQGVLEPLSRTTFKILPARDLASKGKEADDDEFGRQPYGSGPYMYVPPKDRDAPQREAVFRANPDFSQRDGKFGMPHIREIRFVVPKLDAVANEIANRQLHLVLDVPTGDIPRYRDDPIAGGLAKEHTLALNRRIHMLAINHRKTALQNVDLRRGLSAAIDRETILNKVYRPEGTKGRHAALAGPFPFNCWATPANARLLEGGLYNSSLAGGLLNAAIDKGPIELHLAYPQDDPLAQRACGLIKDQIEEASRDEASRKKADSPPRIRIIVDPIPGHEFHRKIEMKHDYDLAYCPYDYRDDLYWLGGLLDRTAADRGGRNFLGYLAVGSNPQSDDINLRTSLDKIRAHRDFRDKVVDETGKLHTHFLARMPFIPLWQLDRHIIVHQGLEMYLDNSGQKLKPEHLDPATIFTGVEKWRLK
ncbi:MAG: hypothetical protein K8T89_04825 [Planctomycetes bacterium]|nr:hypothetical protein [Planctomycetota bacterium]